MEKELDRREINVDFNDKELIYDVIREIHKVHRPGDKVGLYDVQKILQKKYKVDDKNKWTWLNKITYRLCFADIEKVYAMLHQEPTKILNDANLLLIK